jgi:hypothetical protein
LSWPQWNLSDFVMVIAGLAASVALFGVEPTTVLFVLLLPVVLARPSWPLTISAWLVAIGPPVLLILTHYVGWGVLWYQEGARPTSISRPYILNVHNTCEMRAVLSVIGIAGMGIIYSLPVSIAIAWVRIIRSWRRGLSIWVGARPVFALPLVWLVALLILLCGPKEIADWFID